SQKAALLERVKAGVYREAERWALAGAQAKGIGWTALAGEEWISGPWAVLYALNRYIDTLGEIAKGGAPEIDQRSIRERAGGQVVVDVFPATLYDRLLLNGIRAEVWMKPAVTRASLLSTLATWYREPQHAARVALILGAGNISSIAPLDVLYKLVAEGAVCMLKMNPVNGYLGPIFEDAFEPLVHEGFLRFASGGADVGKYLCAHDGIDEIHITGSDKTFDAIVFGEGTDGADRKRRNDPVLKKPISSELGNVSPTIVVPGPWSDADFRFQAENIVTQKMHNAGFNCIASQVLVLPTEWDGTERLLGAVESVLSQIEDRPAYYPGAKERRAHLAQKSADLREFGRSSEGFVPRTLLRVPSEANDDTFTYEAFGSVLTVVTLPGNMESFLKRAVAFANESLWGTLGANLIVHPKTMHESAQAVDAAIAALRYGCIGVNAWTGVGFFISETTWGAFPGHTVDDIQSGTGVVHNSHLFGEAQKSVIFAPFAPFPRSVAGYGTTLLPKPPWFVTNTMSAHIGRALCDFEANKNPLTLARVAALAMRG
ncbi:MAG: aldehyde dehydrogenase family protein, partial [Candidatus Eremiobacteraeota bacterium]|nr:aldehyde dehydrogenase family protein [Candidatus Eremiobacteraeota bacterium]